MTQGGLGTEQRPRMTVQMTRVTCRKCRQGSDIETVANAPIDVYLASVKSAHCPRCGADYRSLGFGGEISEGKPAPGAPIEQRQAWWIERGDVGMSSETIFHCFTGRYVAPGSLRVPQDPDDFSRCKRLLDLMPEWRASLHVVKEKLSWWAPLVDRWAEMERLYSEEFPTGSAPKLYAFMKPLVRLCEDLQRAEKGGAR